MKQEDKELLLKELCARAPYGVKVHIKGESKTPRKIYTVYVEDKTITYFKGLDCFEEDIENVQPYLRLISSMTEEEKRELKELHFYCTDAHIVNEEDEDFKPIVVDEVHCSHIIDWLNRKMFDYRELIPKGLALEAKEGMYNLKEE